jgi:hypothetical protein
MRCIFMYLCILNSACLCVTGLSVVTCESDTLFMEHWPGVILMDEGSCSPGGIDMVCLCVRACLCE